MAHPISRGKFIRSGSTLLGLAWAGIPFDLAGLRKREPHLSFSTLGCPDWTFAQTLDFAVQHGYTGVELRGIHRQLDLTQCPELNSAAHILATRKQVEEKGLSIVDLCSSVELHSADETLWQRHLDEGKRTIDLAQQLHCPFVRVFPNLLPKDQPKEASLDRIAKRLLDLGDHARGSKVSVLMETHGDLVETALLKQVMESAKHPNTGLVWDFYNMWSVTKEPPAQVYDQLKPYIRHAHIKDGITVDGKERLTLMGKGEAPVFEAVQALSRGGYKGYYSFEWEKWWHPEIEAPEIAIGEYPDVMRSYFKRLKD
jgi:sugar phosphate isomerase/epimerase